MPDINQHKLDSMIELISSQTGADSAKLQNAVRSRSVENMLGSLKPGEAQKLQKMLSDKAAMEKLLKTEQAQQLLKKLLEGK